MQKIFNDFIRRSDLGEIKVNCPISLKIERRQTRNTLEKGSNMWGKNLIVACSTKTFRVDLIDIKPRDEDWRTFFRKSIRESFTVEGNHLWSGGLSS